MLSHSPAPALSAPTAIHAVRFVLGPSALLGALGLLRRPDRTVPTPREQWRDAVVDVVIPGHRHQTTIIHCLAALHAQTLKPRQIVLVDDGGPDRDGTAVLAREFAIANRMPLTVIERRWSIGRAPTVKRQAREFDGDVLFVLDADTAITSTDYLQRCVQELYQGVGIASACGTVLPLRGRDRHALSATAAFRRWVGNDEYRDPLALRGRWQRIEQWLSDNFRECTSLVQQRFVQRGQMRAVGGIGHPHGGAVAYRRRYLKDLFDRYEPFHGDSLTRAEDIFIGFALGNEGYRNIQLADVVARAQQVQLAPLPAQIARDAMAYLQGCFHFDALLRTPLRSLRKGWRLRRRPAPVHDQRRVAEAYRQPFGELLTRLQGRPIGWVLVFSAIEKPALPAVLLTLLMFGQLALVGWLLAAELAVWLAVLVLVSREPRPVAALRGLAVAPLRYMAMVADTAGMVGFMRERWQTRGQRRLR
jgi:glycosyltransferase involved in cell wall biosynthesis